MDNHELARWAKRIMKDLTNLTETITEMCARILDGEIESDSARVSISDEARKRKEVK